MNDDRVVLRINFAAQSFELDAPAAIASEWCDRAVDLLTESELAVPSRQRSSTASMNSVDDHPELEADEQRVPSAPVPENFGEFFHRFRSGVTDVDRMLIAGFFLENASDTKSFSTGRANEILKEQGVRVTNPSESLRRNLAVRRVFKLGSREFRVARPTGVEHLRSLLIEGASLET